MPAPVPVREQPAPREVPAPVPAPIREVPAPVQAPPPADRSEPALKPSELTELQEMLRSVREMVEGNRKDILGLRGEMDTRRSRREDTSRVEARLLEEEKKTRELMEKLAATEGLLAAAEAEKRSLSHTVQAQDALLEKQNALKFTDEELAELSRYSAVILFDTCSIMEHPDLLDGVNDGELVVVPKDVNNELEQHKTRFGADDRKIKAQRAITAIFNYKRRFPLTYGQSLPELIPEVYRAEDGEREQNDNKILSVALRYKRYAGIPVIFITDDRSLSNKASGEGLEVWTARDFLTPPETSFEDAAPVAAPVPEAPVEEAPETDGPRQPDAEAERREEARAGFLAQKISAKLLHLEASQVAVLQNNGIRTVADFMARTESDFSAMKAKKGLTFTARFLKAQESIRYKLENL